MWKESRKMIVNIKAKQEKENHTMYLNVSEDIKHKLEGLGITEEKAVAAVTDRYTYHLRGRGLLSRF